MNDQHIIGAYATIRYNDTEASIRENYYFSFEELPEDFDMESFTLPLSGKRDEEVFYYCSRSELLGMVNPQDHLSEFTVLEVTDWVDYYPTQTNLVEEN